MPQSQAALADVLRGAPEKIWIRFFAKRHRKSRIEVVKRDDQAVESRQRQEAADQRIDADRLQRPGNKPDSGRNIVRDVRMVVTSQLIEDLRRHGYCMVQAFANETRRPESGGVKSVVTFIFAREGDEITLDPVDQAWFERRTSTPHDHLSVFANPKRDGDEGPFTRREDTVNIRGMKTEDAPLKIARMTELGKYIHEDA